MFSLLIPVLPVVSATETADLGNVMCVGDSLTHGVNTASWRWAMHKILVDNGIHYTETGVKRGNDSGGVKGGTRYRGVAFQNVHSAQASAHAREVSGRCAGPRFNGTNIYNWLGLDKRMANGSTYSGSVCRADAFFLLIGTNDLLGLENLGATEEAIRAGAEAQYSMLLGGKSADGTRSGRLPDGSSADVPRIVEAAFAASPNAPFTIFSVPAWTTHNRYNINTPAAHESIAAYNGQLQAWVENYNAAHGACIRYVDINHGILDVAAPVPMTGVGTMFNCPGTDGLHPNAQGDLLIAGAVAKACGIPGRTAGLPRRAASAFSCQSGQGVSLAAGETFSLPAEVGAHGFTVEFRLPDGLGDGAAGGWDTGRGLSVCLGDGTAGGTLQISEAYIRWGGKTLYSADMSGSADSRAHTVYSRADAIRVCYIPTGTQEGVRAGFYIWLGDVLIGEACTAEPGGFRGVRFTNGTNGALQLRVSGVEPVPYAPEP